MASAILQFLYDPLHILRNRRIYQTVDVVNLATGQLEAEIVVASLRYGSRVSCPVI